MYVCIIQLCCLFAYYIIARVKPAMKDCDTASLVLESLSLVLSDAGFQLPSPKAAEALSTATLLVAWCQDKTNRQRFSTFSKWLVSSLKSSFRVSGRARRLRSEKMWEQYHQLRISKQFKEEWEKFMTESVGQHAKPTLYQYVSHRVFKKLLEVELEVGQHSRDTDTGKIQPITWEEENALRYVAGYVCRKVQSKIAKSKIENREEMVLCCMDLCGDEEDEDRGTEQWTNAIDRGGLWHISDDTYLIFCLLEEDIRKHLKVSTMKELNATNKRTILDGFMKNEELLFQWTLVTANSDDKVGKEILRQLSELYLTVRGFAFANSCMEMYKQRSKKQLQKSKALRKKVATCSQEDDSDF